MKAIPSPTAAAKAIATVVAITIATMEMAMKVTALGFNALIRCLEENGLGSHLIKLR
jgi:hypothetical protein